MRPITMMMAQKKISTKQGTNLNFNGVIPSYIPTQEPFQTVIYGKSEQAGTPAPDNPVPIQSVQGDFRVSDGTGDMFSFTLPTLHGIGDVADTFEPCVRINGVLRSRHTKWINSRVIDGTETGWNISTAVTAPSLVGYTVPIGFSSIPLWGSSILCDRYSNSTGYNVQGVFRATQVFIFIVPKDEFPTVDDFKSFINVRPATVYYQLADPIITLSDPIPFQTYPTTNIYTTSTVQGNIKATVLVPRNGG